MTLSDVNIVPKLPLGNAPPRSSASQGEIHAGGAQLASDSDAKRSFAEVRSQAGAWEREGRMRMPSDFCSIDDAIAELKAGRMVVLVDDENRENEGDLIIPAQL